MYTLTKNPIQCISPKFFTFFKGLQPCLSFSTPNENFVNNYCLLLDKELISSIQVIFVFLYLLFDNRDKNHMYMDVSWKNSYLFYRNYSCTHVGTAAQIFFFIRALCSHLFTLSANAWTPLSLTLLQLASTDFSHWQRAATCSSIDSPINSLPPHRLKFSSWR